MLYASITERRAAITACHTEMVKNELTQIAQTYHLERLKDSSIKLCFKLEIQDLEQVPGYTDLDTYCMYYTPDEVAQTIGNENSQLSIFSLNCRSINANWDLLNQLIHNVTTEQSRFDFIGLTEVFML